MKQIFKILLLFFLFSSTINAQEYGWGASVGLNYSTTSLSEIFRSSDSLDNTKLSGLNAGLIFNFPLSNYLEFQPEIRFNQQETETRTDYPTSGMTRETGTVFNRLEFPLLLKLKIGGSRFKVNPYLGPNVGANLSGFTETRKSDDSNRIAKTELLKSEYDQFFYENLMGVMVYFKISKTSVVLDYRYGFDFQKTDAIRAAGITKNNGASLNVGLMFNP